ncbi:hypothetical protein DFS34DRAFT_616282 [Phlyctochytrium arcticum]|nr:hypothetical protein DFS34DRAFT_616282 [Phlyctochytrium arcticum]
MDFSGNVRNGPPGLPVRSIPPENQSQRVNTPSKAPVPPTRPVQKEVVPALPTRPAAHAMPAASQGTHSPSPPKPSRSTSRDNLGSDMSNPPVLPTRPVQATPPPYSSSNPLPPPRPAANPPLPPRSAPNPPLPARTPSFASNPPLPARTPSPSMQAAAHVGAAPPCLPYRTPEAASISPIQPPAVRRAVAATPPVNVLPARPPSGATGAAAGRSVQVVPPNNGKSATVASGPVVSRNELSTGMSNDKPGQSPISKFAGMLASATNSEPRKQAATPAPSISPVKSQPGSSMSPVKSQPASSISPVKSQSGSGSSASTAVTEQEKVLAKSVAKAAMANPQLASQAISYMIAHPPTEQQIQMARQVAASVDPKVAMAAGKFMLKNLSPVAGSIPK